MGPPRGTQTCLVRRGGLDSRLTVGVAQLAERQIVALKVVGSSPIIHPVALYPCALVCFQAPGEPGRCS